MFKNKIPELAKKQGISNAYQLSLALKSSTTLAARLWSGDFAKIGVDTLHRLCDLFECQISDFLYYDGNALPVKERVKEVRQ
jgi:DNA-binding Xre family transcriptional regulator